eukprot:m.182386 g.182386  ORF g.182386 m.182386 type:complete len:113 (+) comp17459_c2_seq3:1477-1815(+)
MVTLVRSGIGHPPKVRKTLEALQLTKMNKMMVMKNTPMINGMLKRVISCVEVKPIRFDPTPPADAVGATTLADGRKIFFGHDGIVRGVTEEEFVKAFEVPDDIKDVEPLPKN